MDDEGQHVFLEEKSLMTEAQAEFGIMGSEAHKFYEDDFMKETRAQKWDFVKIICTQKFSKRDFGLQKFTCKSFVFLCYSI